MTSPVRADGTTATARTARAASTRTARLSCAPTSPPRNLRAWLVQVRGQRVCRSQPCNRGMRRLWGNVGIGPALRSSQAAARPASLGLLSRRCTQSTSRALGKKPRHRCCVITGELPPGAGSFYKTRLCHMFEQTGRCSKGAECRYAHGPQELRTAGTLLLLACTKGHAMLSILAGLAATHAIEHHAWIPGPQTAQDRSPSGGLHLQLLFWPADCLQVHA